MRGRWWLALAVAVVLAECGLLLAGWRLFVAPVPQTRILPTPLVVILQPTLTAPAPSPTPGVTHVLLPTAQYPYIVDITDHAREIFLQGQGVGNRPDVFSKVGDSITVSPVFLNPIGAGLYSLHDYAYLQPVVDYYSVAWARTGNSFSNTSLAAEVSWKVGAVLDPANADPAYCQAGESPLACEYRLVKPAVALIMLGTNDVPGTPADAYEASMRRIIETTIAMGVIPVVSTIPPLHRQGLEGRAELLNGIIIRLALEYEIPLWDYGSALKALPDDGLGTDGVHPTWAPSGHSADFAPEYLQYGMTTRNLTALQALDDVWRSVIAPP